MLKMDDLIDNNRMIFREFFKRQSETLINPRIRDLDDMSPFVDLTQQPAMGIVTRAHYRACDLSNARKALGETPILNAIKAMEKRKLSLDEQLSIIHGLDVLGNMYTQHPDRLIPFWLRCKEMNLTQLLLAMNQFPEDPPLTLRPIITQCYMDIVRNLHDIENGVPLEDGVESITEAEFVAFRRTKDMDIRMKFLESTFKIWSARVIQNESQAMLKNRSDLIRQLMKRPDHRHDLSRQFWLVDTLDSQSMHRTSIWHDTDTTVHSSTPNSFLSSIVNQLYYGARLISDYLPKTGFDIDPILPTLCENQLDSISEIMNKTRLYLPADFKKSTSPYKNLQRAFICINDHIKHAKYFPVTPDIIRSHCEKVQWAQDISKLLAEINPDRYGELGYLVNQMHVYLSVTARIRESDVLQINGMDDRHVIIQQCFEIWRIVSEVSPVHITISDFGSLNMTECIRLSHQLKPSPHSVIFALPECSEDTKKLIELLNHRPQSFDAELRTLGVLLEKVMPSNDLGLLFIPLH